MCKVSGIPGLQAVDAPNTLLVIVTTKMSPTPFSNAVVRLTPSLGPGAGDAPPELNGLWDPFKCFGL